MSHACKSCGDGEFTCSIWQCHDALATDGNTGTGSAFGVRVFTLFVATLGNPPAPRHITSVNGPSLLGVSAQMWGVGVPASDSIPYSHRHGLNSVTKMVGRAASATVANVVGMIGTGAGMCI